MLARGLQSLFSDTSLTLIGFILFLIAHASILVRIILTSNQTISDQALLPFSDKELENGSN